MPKHILVASPHPAFGELLRSSIEESSRYRVHLTRTGKSLLDSLKDGDYDAVILDSDVSDMAYTQVGQILLRQYPDLFVLVISPEQDLALLPSTNFVPHAFLDRPFYMPDLLAKLDGLFGLGAAYVEPAEKRAPSWVNDPESATRRLQQNLSNGPVQGALLFEQGQLIAFAGSLLNESEAERLVELLMRHWESDARSDLMRYVRPSNRGGEYQLYARTLAGPVVMALMFEYGIALSQMRATAHRWARTLEDLTPGTVPADLTTTYPYTLRAQAPGEENDADEDEAAKPGAGSPSASAQVGPDTILRTLNYFETEKANGTVQTDDTLSDDDMGWIDTVEDDDGLGSDPLSLTNLLADMPSPDPERSAAREELARILAQEWNVADRDEPAPDGDGGTPASADSAPAFAGVSPVLDADSPELSLEELFPDIFSPAKNTAPDSHAAENTPAPADDFSELNSPLNSDEIPAAGDETAPIDAAAMGWLTEEDVSAGDIIPAGENLPAVEAPMVSAGTGQAALVSSPEAEGDFAEADRFILQVPSVAESGVEEISAEMPEQRLSPMESDTLPAETPAEAEPAPEGVLPKTGLEPFDFITATADDGFEDKAGMDDSVAEDGGGSAEQIGSWSALFGADGTDVNEREGSAAVEPEALPEARDGSELPDWLFSAADEPEPAASESAAHEPRPFWFDELVSTTPVILSPAHEAEQDLAEEAAANKTEAHEAAAPAAENEDLLLPWEQPNNLDWLEHEADTKPIKVAAATSKDQPERFESGAGIPAGSTLSSTEPAAEPEPFSDMADLRENDLNAGDSAVQAPAADAPGAEDTHAEVDWPLAGDRPEPESEVWASLRETFLPTESESPEPAGSTRPVTTGGRPFFSPFLPAQEDALPSARLPLDSEKAAASGGGIGDKRKAASVDKPASSALTSNSAEFAPPFNGAPSDGVAYTCILVPRSEDHRLIADLAQLLESTVPQDCQAFGWYPENVEVRPSYLMWVVQVTSSVSPGSLVRIIRQRTTDRIYQTFPYLQAGSGSDFWAPGSLVVRGSQPPDEKNVREFIENTRRRQNGLSS